MKNILHCDIKVMVVIIFNKFKLQMSEKKVQGISHHNKSILNVMRMFVVISTTRAHQE